MTSGGSRTFSRHFIPPTFHHARPQPKNQNINITQDPLVTFCSLIQDGAVLSVALSSL